MPEVGIDGQRKLKAAQRALHRRRRPRLAGGAVSRRRRRRHASASSTSTSSTSATCSARSCTARRTSAGRSSASAKDRLNAHQSRRQDRDVRDGAVVGERARAVRALRRHPRRHRQLPDALSGERRVRAARQAERLRQHLPLRRAGVGVRDEGRSVLPLPVSRAAAARARAELRRRRRARRAAGHHRR